MARKVLFALFVITVYAIIFAEKVMYPGKAAVTL